MVWPDGAVNSTTGRKTVEQVEFATDSAHAEELDARLRRHAALGYPSEWITPARARELEPMITWPEVDAVAWFPTEGHCWPDRLISSQLAAATDHGARLRAREPVRALDGRRVRLDSGVEDFDLVAVCAGRWTSELAGASIPMVAPAAGNAAVGYLAETGPLARRPDRVITASTLSLRPAQSGGLLLQALDLDGSADPEQPVPDGIRHELARRLAALLPASEPTITVRVAPRSLPLDGLPIVGIADRDRRLYVLATHSGVTLARCSASWRRGRSWVRRCRSWSRTDRIGSARGTHRWSRRRGDQAVSDTARGP